MEKSAFIFMLIETIVFLLPIASLFFKTGKTVQRLDTLEKEVEEHKQNNELTISKLTNTLDAINDKLAQITTSIATIELRLSSLEKKDEK